MIMVKIQLIDLRREYEKRLCGKSDTSAEGVRFIRSAYHKS